ncbi:hypothetical protein BJ875DRAFT_494516 [Amylocarpus encephaloides]|uniref:Uncharacterized protein n=1 Tax=Amylocarpus encephaloides TaxID=45428 RepID=A0A9P8C769_9HELO|nr:hypothetical protein BJ875DRAFT_494516 [Amylocarpus encephaloides]
MSEENSPMPKGQSTTDIYQVSYTAELQARVQILEEALDNSDSQIRPRNFYGPPQIGMGRLTANQRALQPFPHSMSVADGVKVWWMMVVLWIYVLWTFTPFHLFGSAVSGYFEIGARFIFFLFSSKYVLGSNIYPLIYAILLRVKNGSWPTAIQVQGCEKDKEEEKAKGAAGTPVHSGKDLLRILPWYMGLGGFILNSARRTVQNMEQKEVDKALEESFIEAQRRAFPDTGSMA